MSNRESTTVLVTARRAIFDGMCWPMPPDQAMFNRIHCSNADEPLSLDDKGYVAAVLGAYGQLIDMTARDRKHRVRRLREAIKIHDTS